MIELANSAQTFGSGDIRLSYDQNCYVVDIDADQFTTFEEEERVFID